MSVTMKLHVFLKFDAAKSAMLPKFDAAKFCLNNRCCKIRFMVQLYSCTQNMLDSDFEDDTERME